MSRERWLLRAFPRPWRDRYGDELLELINDQPGRRGQTLDLLRCGLRERLHRVNLSAITHRFVTSGRPLRFIAVGLLIALTCAHGLAAGGWAPRLGLIAGSLGLATSLSTTVIPRLRRSLDPMLRLRMLTMSCVVLAAASILVTAAQSAPNKPIPRPPSIASTLSPTVAHTPGILAFLKSSNPKSIEFDPTTGKTVWVGKGLITWTGHLIRHVPAGVTTVAGRYQPQT